MSIRTATAQWEGHLKTGHGQFALGSGAWSAPYSFKTRFAEEQGTNPEELIAAAHASCYSMALSGALEQAGHPSRSIETKASVRLDAVQGGFAIAEIALVVRAQVPGIHADLFQTLAEQTKINCPVSKALASVPITLSAELLA